jgi:transposase-like protein
MAQRRIFTKEFKEEAMAPRRTSGRSKTYIAKDLSIAVNMLCRWKRVERLMWTHGLQTKRKKKRGKTTDSSYGLQVEKIF